MDIKEKISKVMKQAVDHCEVMGVNLLVEKGGEELLYCEEGMADRENRRLISRDTIFRLYSQTKPVTAACAMILMERGLLDPGEFVSEYLPSYSELKTADIHGTSPAKQPLRIIDLLNMTSGMVYPDDCTEPGKAVDKVFAEACDRLDTERPMTTRELADRLARCPLAFEPGNGWRYGTSADVLGAVIEVISEKKLSEFMQDELFAPLEMKDTAFWVPDEKQGRLAKAYETVTAEDGSKSMQLYTGNNLAVRNDMAKPPAYEAGGAGLVSTLDDYMKFAQMLMQGGSLNGVRVLSEKTTKYFTSPELMPVSQKVFSEWVGLDGYSYGNLMRVCKNPAQCGYLAMQDEYGWDGWLGVYFANLPNEKTTILMGMQKVDAGTFSMTRKIRNRIVSKL